MAKTDEEILESYKKRIRRQNNSIKEKFDRVSATLPKGTIKRINDLGISISGAINNSLLPYLDCLEKAQKDAFNGLESNNLEAVEEITADLPKQQEKPTKTPEQDRYEQEDFENLNNFIRRAQEENATRHEAQRQMRRRKSVNEAIEEMEDTERSAE